MQQARVAAFQRVAYRHGSVRCGSLRRVCWKGAKARARQHTRLPPLTGSTYADPFGLGRGQVGHRRAHVLRRASAPHRGAFACDLLRAFPVVHGAQRQRIGGHAVAAHFVLRRLRTANGRLAAPYAHSPMPVAVRVRPELMATMRSSGARSWTADGLAGVHQAAGSVAPGVPLRGRRFQNGL